jgi:hypothetical protein
MQILTGIQGTDPHQPETSVTADAAREAHRWLGRQLSWERRLARLEAVHHRPVLVGPYTVAPPRCAPPAEQAC